jgi:hypothetical protein
MKEFDFGAVDGHNADVSADLNAPKREVRLAPINGHRQLGGALPKSATIGHAVTSIGSDIIRPLEQWEYQDRLHRDGVSAPRVCRLSWGWGPLKSMNLWGDRATAPFQDVCPGGFPGCVAIQYKIRGSMTAR